MKVVPAFLAFGSVILFGVEAHAAPAPSGPKVIALIGGPNGEHPFEDDHQGGVNFIAKLLEESSGQHGLGKVAVRSFLKGWPAGGAGLENVSTVVWYFGEADARSLQNKDRKAEVDRLLASGVGVVALHEASVSGAGLGGLPAKAAQPASQVVAFTPAPHPVSRGVDPFAYKDAFASFARPAAGVTPILTTQIRDAGQNGQRTVAWAFDRPGGGRSFAFSGLHHLSGLDSPELRKLLLNAVVWTAGLDVPAHGVESGPPLGAAGAMLTKADKVQVLPQSWGELTWYTSAEMGNSATMTTGQAVIAKGSENPRHYHPNCDEILRVVSGRIIHTLDDKSVEMGPGDVVTIPLGVKHNARNIGDEPAVLAISFSSAFRRVVGE